MLPPSKLAKPIAKEPEILAELYGRCLKRREFIYPNGATETYGLWGWLKKHPSILFPVTTNSEVITVRQFRHGANDFAIETPGGCPKGDQSAKEAASMEFLEETGYKAGSMQELGPKIWMDGAANDMQFTPFLALDCVKVSDPKPDSTEILETFLIPLSDWYEMIWSGEVTESRIIALSLLAMPYLGIRIQF
jgi:8-oxo-dGTP pyrophosphatase MutT (NUDIX family)